MMKSMRILAVSDIHGYVDMLRKVLEIEVGIDVIVFAGDIAPYRSPQKTFEYLSRALDIAKMYRVSLFLAVPGNMDIAEHYNRIESPAYVNLHNAYKLYGDHIFLGIGGSTPTPFRTLFELTEDDIERSLEGLYNSIRVLESTKTLVLVSHAPPYGTKCDTAYTGSHIGSRAIRNFIEKHKPALSICGHVHESRCIDTIENTVVVNPGPLSRGFYAVIELGREGVRAYQRSL